MVFERPIENQHMKHLALLLLFCLAAFLLPAQTVSKKKKRGAKQDTVKTYPIELRITQTSSYCGGAEPTQEQLQRQFTPMPLPGKTVYIKRGKSNSSTDTLLIKVKADDKGFIHLKLAPGAYCVVEEFKTQPLVIPPNSPMFQYNAECLEQRWKSCDEIFYVVPEGNQPVSINYHKRCGYEVPCGNYNGPMPP